MEAGAETVKEVERRIRVTDGVVKFMTVRVDEELRKAERRKAQRTSSEERKRTRQASRGVSAEAEGGRQ